MIELKLKFGIISTVVLVVLSIAISFYKGEKYQTAITLILFTTLGYGFLYIFKDIPSTYLAIKENIMTYGDGTSILRPLTYTVLDILIMVYTWNLLAKRAKRFPQTDDEGESYF